MIAAFNAADWDQIRATIAPQCGLYRDRDAAARRESRRLAAIAGRGWKQALPDAQGTVHKAVSQGNTVVQEITWVGTQTGPLPTPAGMLPPSGKAFRVAAAIWYTVDGERVQEIHHYLDVLALLQQLGAQPG